MESIKKDTFVTEYVGEVITSEEAERRGKIYGLYDSSLFEIQN